MNAAVVGIVVVVLLVVIGGAAFFMLGSGEDTESRDDSSEMEDVPVYTPTPTPPSPSYEEPIVEDTPVSSSSNDSELVINTEPKGRCGPRAPEGQKNNRCMGDEFCSKDGHCGTGDLFKYHPYSTYSGPESSFYDEKRPYSKECGPDFDEQVCRGADICTEDGACVPYSKDKAYDVYSKYAGPESCFSKASGCEIEEIKEEVKEDAKEALNTKVVKGNNGSVSCKTYCAGTNGGPWNNELPKEWGGAKCVSSPIPGQTCDSVKGSPTECLCEKDPSNPWYKAPTPPKLHWAHAESQRGGKHCVKIAEPSDTAGTWSDNYLCFDSKADADKVKWSYAGPISGMDCQRVHEAAEPRSTNWHDNYICTSKDSKFDLTFSQAGPFAGGHCVQMKEPSDPHTWTDNYMCAFPKGKAPASRGGSGVPPAAPATPGHNMRCGPKFNNQKCPEGNTCSRFSWCGKGSAWEYDPYAKYSGENTKYTNPVIATPQPTKEEIAKSCYGTHKGGKICKTCQDVVDAYRATGWRYDKTKFKYCPEYQGRRRRR